jgi:hypothetical protein
MSRYAPDQKISLLSWRIAMAGLIIVTGAVIAAALLIARQGQALPAALTPARIDEHWAIRSGSAEADRLVLQPAPHSIALALRPVESAAFVLQARVAFNSSRGAAGLIVQSDDLNHFSAFLISSDGYFRVSDYRDGVWSDRAAWRAWPHIRRDGSANVLRAECQALTCTFFVNDEWTWQEHALLATRRIGVVADAQAASDPFEARFDQIAGRP